MPKALVLELVGPKSPLYPGRYAHGLFFALLRELDPDLSEALHAAPRKPFTLTPLPEGENRLFLRFATLDDGLFSRFLLGLVEKAPTGLPLGDTDFRLTRVLADPRGHPLAGAHRWEELRDQEGLREATLCFLTPTVFITSKAEGRTRYTPLPDPRLILSSLLDKWQAHSPFPYTPKEEGALRAIFELDTEIKAFRNLRFHRVWAGKASFPGFTGEVTLRLWQEAWEARLALGRLAALAFYSGVGAKTPFGMGLALARP